jgi:hypothetical protein
LPRRGPRTVTSIITCNRAAAKSTQLNRRKHGSRLIQFYFGSLFKFFTRSPPLQRGNKMLPFLFRYLSIRLICVFKELQRFS